MTPVFANHCSYSLTLSCLRLGRMLSYNKIEDQFLFLLLVQVAQNTQNTINFLKLA